MSGRRWTESEKATVRLMYPRYAAEEIAAALGRSERQVYRVAHSLGCRKSREWMAERTREALADPRHPGRRTSFKRGQVPWNKGKPFNPGGRSVETRFKPGRRPEEARNYKPIGSTRVSRDGYLERKVSDDRALSSSRRWVGVHRLVWEATHGPVPRGHIVTFRPGCRTTVEEEITVEKLELISRTQGMERNSVHRYPPEIKRVLHRIGRARKALEARS